MTFTVDAERVKQKVAFIQETIIREANPQLLNEYRLLFKKEIPFFRRSWAAAYLLMLYDQGQDRQNFREGEIPKNKARNPGRGNYTIPEENSRGWKDRNPGGPAEGINPRLILAEEESKWLFISIGRNRRLFPREILSLIINTAQVEREDIGSIRILDSYSFVQVRNTVVNKIIEALNGAMFRGRTLTVNYAHNKRDGGDDAEAGNNPPEKTESPAPEEPLDLGIEQGDDSPDKESI
ncbi:MAG: DbpA RNA binding domain-containing protein [Treponema sp.]|jgi:hypothetical protein|nr:DbpA RNA binding domain-containing protein [Treponema sp.]